MGRVAGGGVGGGRGGPGASLTLSHGIAALSHSPIHSSAHQGVYSTQALRNPHYWDYTTHSQGLFFSFKSKEILLSQQTWEGIDCHPGSRISTCYLLTDASTTKYVKGAFYTSAETSRTFYVCLRAQEMLIPKRAGTFGTCART